ncbi:hypothetical protein AURDEDRAFT_72858 [Auricularia subglabra TFB-10046 SS5]|uniref:Glycosyltransferase family 69 protein n=1 Tax=Auricularia subglabra (strain TFB-10046 / SS5) TaxID=717982 RepID=J0WUV5_AURST|nr:hypothetical protein AURDEDRAFT_72858 [Auricularia subglabra TFB-10046 SS5]
MAIYLLHKLRKELSAPAPTGAIRLQPLADDEDDYDDTDIPLAPSPQPKKSRIAWSAKLSLSCGLVLCGLYMLGTVDHPDDSRHTDVLLRSSRKPKLEGYGNGEKVFIAALFYNNADILPHWTRQMTRVIQYMGVDNVFVSIMESWSTDSTPTLLSDFDKALGALGVERRIKLRDTTVSRPSPFLTNQARINFLAASRNVALEPLADGLHGAAFDRILFSNDVITTAESIVELLNTRDGKYDMACGLDFAHWGIGDGWVLRDRLGQLVSSIWPYFVEDAGTNGVTKSEPFKVLSCWNGIAALRAEPFLPPAKRTNGTLSAKPLRWPLAHSHPSYQPERTPPRDLPELRFRASAAEECFSSECLLLAYDLRVLYALEEIWINPRVLSAYSWDNYYLWIRAMRHWLVQWWIRTVENGDGIERAKWIEGRYADVWMWEGGACQVVSACLPHGLGSYSSQFHNYTRPEAHWDRRRGLRKRAVEL